MLQLNLKQSIVLLAVIAALLIALVFGVIRADTSHNSPAGYSGSHSAQLAWYCPAPPMGC